MLLINSYYQISIMIILMVLCLGKILMIEQEEKNQQINFIPKVIVFVYVFSFPCFIGDVYVYIYIYIYVGWVQKKKGGWVADFGPLVDGWEMRSRSTHRGIKNIKVLSKGTCMTCTYIDLYVHVCIHIYIYISSRSTYLFICIIYIYIYIYV